MTKQNPIHVYVSADFLAKNLPDNYIGLRRDHWKFGKNSPVEIHELCVSIVIRLLEFYFTVTDEGDVVDVLDKISTAINKMRSEIAERRNKVHNAVEALNQ